MLWLAHLHSAAPLGRSLLQPSQLPGLEGWPGGMCDDRGAERRACQHLTVLGTTFRCCAHQPAACPKGVQHHVQNAANDLKKSYLGTKEPKESDLLYATCSWRPDFPWGPET